MYTDVKKKNLIMAVHTCKQTNIQTNLIMDVPRCQKSVQKFKPDHSEKGDQKERLKVIEIWSYMLLEKKHFPKYRSDYCANVINQ